MKKEIMAQLSQITSVKTISEKSAMSFLFKNLEMLLTDVSMYLSDNFGIELSQPEKAKVMKMSVKEFLEFLRRKLKDKNKSKIDNIVHRLGYVPSSVNVLSTDKVRDIVGVEEGRVTRFVVALSLDFEIDPSEEEIVSILRMTVGELSDHLTIM